MDGSAKGCCIVVVFVVAVVVDFLNFYERIQHHDSAAVGTSADTSENSLGPCPIQDNKIGHSCPRS